MKPCTMKAVFPLCSVGFQLLPQWPRRGSWISVKFLLLIWKLVHNNFQRCQRAALQPLWAPGGLQGFHQGRHKQFLPGRSCLSGSSMVSHSSLQHKDNKQWRDLRKATYFVPLIPRLGFRWGCWGMELRLTVRTCFTQTQAETCTQRLSHRIID